MGSQDSATALDERLASNRTKWHLSGTSRSNEIARKLEEEQCLENVCWRDVKDVRVANNTSISNLRKGLALARQKVVKVRERALAGLSGREAEFLTLGIQILVDQTKGKEILKYNATQQRLIERNRDCSNHIVCRWMRRRLKGWSQSKFKPQPDSDTVKTNSDTVMIDSDVPDSSNTVPTSDTAPDIVCRW